MFHQCTIHHRDFKGIAFRLYPLLGYGLSLSLVQPYAASMGMVYGHYPLGYQLMPPPLGIFPVFTEAPQLCAPTFRLPFAYFYLLHL